LWIELPLDLITGLISLIYPLLDGLVSSDIFPHAFLAIGFAPDAGKPWEWLLLLKISILNSWP
jgi:hypothetical protein